MKHREVFAYEVELKLVNPNTKETKLVTRDEQAYGPFDAYMQAIIGASVEAGSAEIKVVHVRPVADAITASQASLTKEIADALRRVGVGHK